MHKLRNENCLKPVLVPFATVRVMNQKSRWDISTQVQWHVLFRWVSVDYVTVRKSGTSEELFKKSVNSHENDHHFHKTPGLSSPLFIKMSLMLLQSLVSFGLLASASASFVFQLNGTSYYSPDEAVGNLAPEWTQSILHPTRGTLLSLSSNWTSINADQLEAVITDFAKRDDVFSSYFLSVVAISDRFNQLSDDATQYLDAIGATVLYFSGQNSSLPSGPYLFHPSGKITRVYRLYRDYNFAFETPVTQTLNGSYVPVTGAVEADANGALSIAVPSRLYYPPPSRTKPLSGTRLVVKDNYDLKGIRTVAGSRAIRELNDPADETAPSLQKLIDLGAVVIGKVKTTQVALGEVPA